MIGTAALLVLVGDAGLDTARLYRESRATIESLELILTGADSGPNQAAAS